MSTTLSGARSDIPSHFIHQAAHFIQRAAFFFAVADAFANFALSNNVSMKHLRAFIIIAFTAILAFSAVSCGDRALGSSGTGEERPRFRGIYHWKNVYDPSAYELDFLRRHGVTRLYVKLFDVVADYDNKTLAPIGVPSATVVFKQVPDSAFEVVPVVFITREAVDAMYCQDAANASYYAGKIIKRIYDICKANNIFGLKEVQLDCDYSARQQEAFYKLCHAAKWRLNMQDIKLSVTVRLHNLRQEPPPADSGVLMVYNTASVRNPNTRNSIIDPADVNSFLRRKPRYALPLDMAYPTFSWSVVADSGRVKLSRRTDWNDTTFYQRTGANTYTVKGRHFMDGTELSKGAEIRVERSDFASVMAAKRIVDNAFRQDTQRNVLLYHLDSLNLSKFTDDEIQDIYCSR